MRTGKINRHNIEIYDSIDEMPIMRFQKYNKYMLIDSGVGSDIQDIIDHIDRAKLYVKANPNMAIIEMNNLRQAIYLVNNEMSPKYMAFAVLVHKIDGKIMDDISDAGLQRVMNILKEAKKGWLDGVLNFVKKKIDRELNLYFPGRFTDVATKEYYDILKDRTLLRLKKIITGENVDEQCKEIDTRLAIIAKPRIFSGNNSVEISYDKQFEDMCLILSQNLQIQPREMNVLQFYNAFDYLKRQIKKNKAK